MTEVLGKPLDFLTFLRQVSTYPLDGISALPDGKNAIEWLYNEKNFRLDELRLYYDCWLAIPQYKIEKVDLGLTKYIPEEIARRYLALPVKLDNEELIIAFANPLKVEAVAAVVQAVRNFKVIPAIAKEEDLEYALQSAFQHVEEMQDLAEQLNVLAIEENVKKVSDYEVATVEDDSQVSQLLNTILNDAIEQNASDIHIEYENQTLHVRYRIATVLVEQASLPRNTADILLRRLLIISKGDITELRLPQDTSFDYIYREKKYGVRASFLFTSTGYTVVLRLLKGSSFYQSLRNFIYEDTVYQSLEKFLNGRSGMLLISGPTSSGKTTTIYSALSYVNNASTKIITMEDPVESEIPGVNQVEINPAIGLDFSDVIRSCLRQNPDVLMVGEIRDQVSASMSLRAAVTGIMVMATIHTKNTSAIVLRLLDLGVEAAMIAMGINLMVSQRLVLLLCDHCRVVTPLTETELQVLDALDPKYRLQSFYTCSGCVQCSFTGYSGPLAIFELLEMDQELANSILSQERHKFAEIADKKLQGKTLLDKALGLALEGKISLKEVFKISYTGSLA
ncbi:MAG: biosis protein MshE [Gammaproteobacteria bacterium]|jgi:MSHA biogenesis protein MshE|nr:biosis protein MshE [Gammaproteobacteria bacterium]